MEEVTLYNKHLTLYLDELLKDVTSETINKVYNPKEYQLNKEDILRKEYSLVPDEDFWFNRYLRSAAFKISSNIKNLNKGKLQVYEIYNNGNDIVINQIPYHVPPNITFNLTLAENYPVDMLRDLITHCIVYYIVYQWYVMKNLMDIAKYYNLMFIDSMEDLSNLSTKGVTNGDGFGRRIYNIGLPDYWYGIYNIYDGTLDDRIKISNGNLPEDEGDNKINTEFEDRLIFFNKTFHSNYNEFEPHLNIPNAEVCSRYKVFVSNADRSSSSLVEYLYMVDDNKETIAIFSTSLNNIDITFVKAGIVTGLINTSYNNKDRVITLIKKKIEQ